MSNYNGIVNNQDCSCRLLKLLLMGTKLSVPLYFILNTHQFNTQTQKRKHRPTSAPSNRQIPSSFLLIAHPLIVKPIKTSTTYQLQIYLRIRNQLIFIPAHTVSIQFFLSSYFLTKLKRNILSCKQ